MTESDMFWQEQTKKVYRMALIWHISVGSDEVIANCALNRFISLSQADKGNDNLFAFEDKKDLPLNYSRQSACFNVLSESSMLSSSNRNQSLAIGLKQEDNQTEGLQKLKAEINNFEGLSIKATATNLVFGEGAVSPLVMFIGEAPGADEDRQGRPFVGRAGQLLDKMISTINLNRHDNVYITNILPWRPPGNRTPNANEISACLPFVRQHIALVKPRVVVALGGVAASALMDTVQGIMRLRGQWNKIVVDENRHHTSIPLLAMFHPAFLLRQPMRKRETWQDLRILQRYIMSL